MMETLIDELGKIGLQLSASQTQVLTTDTTNVPTDVDVIAWPNKNTLLHHVSR